MAKADAQVTLGVDGKPVEDGLKKAERQVDTFGKRASSAMKKYGDQIKSTLVGAFAISAIRNALNEFDRMGKLATRFNDTAENMQRLAIVAKNAGTDIESVASALNKLNMSLVDPKAAAQFEKLGLSAAELASKGSYDQIKLLNQAFQEAQKKGMGFAEVTKLMGKGAADLIPILKSLQDQFEEIDETPVASNSTIAKLEQFNDTLSAIDTNIKAGLVTMVAFPGVLGDMVGHLKEGATFAEAFADAFSSSKADADAMAKQAARDAQSAQLKQEALDAINEKAEAERAKKQQLLATLHDEMRLLRAKASGNEEAVAKVEREIAIKAKAAQLEAQGLMTKAQALRMAEMMVNLAQKEKDLIKEKNDEEKAQEDKQKEVDKLEARQKLLDMVQRELALAQAKANFDEAEVKRLERQAEIQKKKNELIKDGMDPASAEAVATQMQDLKEQEERGPGAKRRSRTIRGGGGLDQFYLDQQAKALGIGLGQRGRMAPNQSAVTGRSAAVMNENEVRRRLGIAPLMPPTPVDAAKTTQTLLQRNNELQEEIKTALQRLTVE